MKNWLTKFKISAALDEAKPLPKSLQHRIEQSQELRQFVDDRTELEAALRSKRPAPSAPSWLHGSIMSAVRRAEMRPARWSLQWKARWLGAPALAGILVLAAWWGRHGSVEPKSPTALSTEAAVLHLGEQLPRTIPMALVSPLDEELARVNRDVDNAAQFLLGSLP